MLGSPLVAQPKLPAPGNVDALSKADPAGNQAWSVVGDAFTDNAKVPALSRADLAKSFYQNFPQHPRALEARKLEVMALLDAGVPHGPGSRLRTTAQALRADASVPEKDRAIIAGFYDLRLAAIGLARREDVLAAYEAAARGLTVEFPRQPQGYVTMLTLAGEKGNPHGLALARELASSPNAPEAVSRRAQRLVTRLSLVGRKLSEILPNVPAAQPDGSGKLTIVYAWSAADPGSLTLVRELAKLQVDRARWIGVNLDAGDARPSSEKLAADGKFPGTQIYDDRGAEGQVASALGFDAAPVALFVGSDGVVADVHAAGSLLQTLPYFGL